MRDRRVYRQARSALIPAVCIQSWPFCDHSMLETDIMLVDEVLSVGDERFRRKSLEKMKSLIHMTGTVHDHRVPQHGYSAGNCVTVLSLCGS